MELIRYTHSCVRVERDGRVLVIDPGIWSEPRALLGTDAVLVTHEHVDHVDEMRLAGLGVPWLKTAEAIEFVRTVGPERAIGIHDTRSLTATPATGPATSSGQRPRRAEPTGRTPPGR